MNLDPTGVFAALVAMGTLGWTLYRDVADRARLKVVCKVGEIAVQGDAFQRDRVLSDCLIWQVTNTGNRPVVVTKVGGERTDGSQFGVPSHGGKYPHTLAPGDYLIEYTRDLDSGLSEDVRALHVIDSRDRPFRAPRRQVARLKREHAERRARMS